MKEFVCLHVGQAGIQIGNSCWELFANEHNVNAQGRLISDPIGNLETFFNETEKGKFIPRSIFIDSEPEIINEIKRGKLKDFYNPDYFINGEDGASDNYIRGYYNVGRLLRYDCERKIEKLTENCTNLKGFIIFNSTVGGSGSGIGQLVLEYLSRQYSKIPRIAFSIFPSELYSYSTVEPYNFLLSAGNQINYADATIMLENQAIYKFIENNFENSLPTLDDVNNTAALAVSSMTSSIRFNGDFNKDLNEFLINILINKTLNFLSPSFSPILNSKNINKMTVNQITENIFKSSSFFVKSQPHYGKYISACLYYRGDVSPSQIYSSLINIKKNKDLNFIFSSNGLKCGLNYEKSKFLNNQIKEIDKSLCMIANITSTKFTIENMLKKFRKIFERSSFYHWYVGEGLSTDTLLEAEENLISLVNVYDEIEKESINEYIDS